MSAIAKNGLEYEKIFEKNDRVCDAFCKHFKLDSIVGCMYPSRKKTDVVVIAKDMFGMERQFRIQIKKFMEGFRGNSIDRRSSIKFSMCFDDPVVVNACVRKFLIQRRIVRNDIKSAISTAGIYQYLTNAIFGVEDVFKPQYVLMISQVKQDLSVYLVDVNYYFGVLLKNIDIKFSKTCIVLSPVLYIQKKGSEKHDKNHDDLQLKAKLSKNMFKNKLFQIDISL